MLGAVALSTVRSQWLPSRFQAKFNVSIQTLAWAQSTSVLLMLQSEACGQCLRASGTKELAVEWTRHPAPPWP